MTTEQNFTAPLKYATEIDTEGKFNLSPSELTQLVASLQACGGEKNIKRCAEVFKKLPREELVSRISTISRLYSVMLNVRLNSRNVISSPSPFYNSK
jgi:hypothetical protein